MTLTIPLAILYTLLVHSTSHSVRLDIPATSWANFSEEQIEFLRNFSSAEDLLRAVEIEHQERKMRRNINLVNCLLLSSPTIVETKLLPCLDWCSQAHFNALNKISYKSMKGQASNKKHYAFKQQLLDEGYTEANARIVCKNPAWKAYMDVDAHGLEKTCDFDSTIGVSIEIRKKIMLSVLSKASPQQLKHLSDANPWPAVSVDQWLSTESNIAWNIWEEDRPFGKKSWWNIFRRYNPQNGSHHLTLKEINQCYNKGIRSELARELKALETPTLPLFEFLETWWNIPRIREIISEGAFQNLQDVKDALFWAALHMIRRS